MTTRQPRGRSTTEADCRWHGRSQSAELGPNLGPSSATGPAGNVKACGRRRLKRAMNRMAKAEPDSCAATAVEAIAVPARNDLLIVKAILASPRDKDAVPVRPPDGSLNAFAITVGHRIPAAEER